MSVNENEMIFPNFYISSDYILYGFTDQKQQTVFPSNEKHNADALLIFRTNNLFRTVYIHITFKGTQEGFDFDQNFSLV